MDSPGDRPAALHEGVWTLYWPDRHSKFRRYADLEPTPTVDRLLAEIDADPICIFWG